MEKNSMDNRCHERIPYRSKINVYRYYNMNGVLVTPDEPIELVIFDVSLSGLGVISQQAFSGQATLEFTFYLEDIPYQVMAKIAWSKHNHIFFRYGLEIIGHNNMLFRHLKEFTSKHSTAE